MATSPMEVFDVAAPEFGAQRDYDPATATGTDDYGAIQTAMHALAAAGGGTLYFPPGNYLASAGPPNSGNGVIEPVSNCTVLFDPAAALYIHPGTVTRYFLVRIEDVHDVSIVGATLVGRRNPALAAVQAHGILVKSSSQVSIRGCRVVEVRHDGIYVGGGPSLPSHRVAITGTTCDRAGRNGLRIAHGRDVLVEGCSFVRTSGIPEEAGADIEPEGGNSNEDIRFIGNRCAENGTTGLTVSSRPAQTGVIVSGNTFERNGTHGVNCGGSGVVLHGNILRANGGSGMKMSAFDMSASGNTFADNGHFGINVGGEAHDCLLVGNRFAGNPDGATDGEFDATTLLADNAGMGS